MIKKLSTKKNTHYVNRSLKKGVKQHISRKTRVSRMRKNVSQKTRKHHHRGGTASVPSLNIDSSALINTIDEDLIREANESEQVNVTPINFIARFIIIFTKQNSTLKHKVYSNLDKIKQALKDKYNSKEYEQCAEFSLKTIAKCKTNMLDITIKNKLAEIDINNTLALEAKPIDYKITPKSFAANFILSLLSIYADRSRLIYFHMETIKEKLIGTYEPDKYNTPINCVEQSKILKNMIFPYLDIKEETPVIGSSYPSVLVNKDGTLTAGTTSAF